MDRGGEQLTLFGTPAPPPTRHTGAAAANLAADLDPESRPHRAPSFEQRARLRNERHRLVSELTRRDGSTHREINGWINRKVGITSVEDASLDDLERSVELLLTKLTGRP